jgi:hypothetical protein
MSDIHSNYPRTKVAISHEKANLADVTLVGGYGKLAVTVILIAIIVLRLGPLFGYSANVHTSAYGFATLVIIAASLAYFVNLYKWSSQTHYAVCLLKGYSPRISPALVGIGCALSLFLFAIPIWLTFDFLITHSDPTNSESPNFSWSPAALKFYIPYALYWLSLFAQFLPFWNPTVLFVTAIGRYLLLAFAVWSGCRMIGQIDKNLQSLARIAREQTAPTDSEGSVPIPQSPPIQ